MYFTHEFVICIYVTKEWISCENEDAPEVSVKKKKSKRSL